ncbi:MAG TPA: LysM domain-containing protein [archaeon]|nr:LysM domain-containing protein [archaeon]
MVVNMRDTGSGHGSPVDASDMWHETLRRIVGNNIGSIIQDRGYTPDGDDGLFYRMVRKHRGREVDLVLKEFDVNLDGHGSPSTTKDHGAPLILNFSKGENLTGSYIPEPDNCPAATNGHATSKALALIRLPAGSMLGYVKAERGYKGMIDLPPEWDGIAVETKKRKGPFFRSVKDMASILGAVAAIGVAAYSSLVSPAYFNRQNAPTAIVETAKPAKTIVPLQAMQPVQEPEYSLFTSPKGYSHWKIATQKMGAKSVGEVNAAIKELRAYNGLDPNSDLLLEGQVVKIPRKTNINDVVDFKYTVKPDDVLSGISVKFYGTNKMVNDIARDSGIADPNKINTGDVLTLRMPKWKADQISTNTINTPTSDPKNYVSNIGRKHLNESELARASIDISAAYKSGVSASRLADDYVGLNTNDVYKMVAETKRSEGGTYKWNRRLAEATGELGTVEDMIYNGRKAGKSASVIAREIKDITGFEMSTSTIYRMNKKASDVSYKSTFGYSKDEVADMYNANIAKGMNVEDAYMRAIGQFKNI